jgi:hypothetical protein
MMSYEVSKDVCLASQTVVDTDNTRIAVEVKQYNGGDVKVSIERSVKTKKGEWKFAKLRRLAADEVQPVAVGLAWATTQVKAITGKTATKAA